MTEDPLPIDIPSANKQFFADFVNRYNARYPARWISVTPSRRNWLGISRADAPGAGYNVGFVREGRFRVEITFQNRNREFNKQAFDQLFRLRESIQAEIGAPLEWERKDAIKRSQISVYYPGIATVADPEPNRSEYLEWAVDMADRFQRVLDKQIAALDLG